MAKPTPIHDPGTGTWRVQQQKRFLLLSSLTIHYSPRPQKSPVTPVVSML
jgi:hypothetical protein